MQQQAIIIQEPNWLEPIFENIPHDLMDLPWGVWRAEPRLDKQKKPTDKWSKAPRNPTTGEMVGTNKPHLFGTFQQARSAYLRGIFTGVGVLLKNSGIVGIDIDDGKNLIKRIPELREWLLKADQIGAYCELSPSGKGLRIFVNGSLPCGGMKSDGLEIYQNVRFLTVTGNVISRGVSNE